MKTMLALVLLVACASQAYSSCAYGKGTVVKSTYPAYTHYVGHVSHPYYHPLKAYHPTVVRHCTCGSCDGCQYKKPSCVEQVHPKPVYQHPAYPQALY